MEQSDGDVRLLRFHSLQNAGDAGAVDLVVGAGVVLIEDVHQIIVSGGKSPAAQTFGKGHEGNLDALSFRDGVALGLLELGLRSERTHRLQARRPDGLQGGSQANQAVVDGAGIGHLDQVNARVAQSIQQFPGGRGGVAAIGFAADVALQVQHGQIRVGQSGRHVHEGAGVIVAAHGYTGVDYSVGHVQVTRCLDVDGGFGAFLSAGGRFCRLGGLLGGTGLRRHCRLGTVGTAGEEHNPRRTQHQHHRRQNQRDTKPLSLGLLLSALGFPLFTAHIHFIVVQRHGVVLPILNDALLYCISSDKTRGYSPK